MADKADSLQIKKALADKHYKDFFLTEVNSGSVLWTPKGELKRLDALAIKKSYSRTCFTGYEVKVSRGDFLRDAKFYTYEELVNELYIVCPKGMIRREELPESVGLMYYDAEKNTLLTKKKAIFRTIEYSPEMLLYIIFSRLDSDRVPFFTKKEEYCREYVRHEIDNRTLGKQVSSRLIEENARLERELQEHEWNGTKKKLQTYRRIREVLEEYDVWMFGTDDEICERIRERMNGTTTPKQIRYAREHVETALRSLEKLEGKEVKTDG